MFRFSVRLPIFSVHMAEQDYEYVLAGEFAEATEDGASSGDEHELAEDHDASADYVDSAAGEPSVTTDPSVKRASDDLIVTTLQHLQTA